MASYNRRDISGSPSILVEGIAIDPEFQAKGLFKEITDLFANGESAIFLRTQNPRMYAALANYCSSVYPNPNMDIPIGIRDVHQGFASYLGSEISFKGVVKGHYGGLLYGEEPTHPIFSEFFKNDLEMDLHNGDAVLLLGYRSYEEIGRNIVHKKKPIK